MNVPTLVLPKELPRADKVVVGHSIDGKVYVLFCDEGDRLLMAIVLNAEVGQTFKREVVAHTDAAVLQAAGELPETGAVH